MTTASGINVHIRGTGMELTPSVEEYVRKKADAISKYIGSGDSALDLYVEIGKTTSHHKQGEVFRSEWNLHTSRGDFRVEREEADLYAAIDNAKEEMEDTLRASKDKRMTLWRAGRQKIKNLLKFGR